MSNLNAEEYKTFESIKHIRENGTEFWYARELAKVLDYMEWRNFQKVIDRAILACKNSGFAVSDHFVEVNKMIEIGKGGKRNTIDYELTRYACYLIVQNGDPRKEIIALGQTYFAIQTRRQEVQDAFNQLDENNKRLVVRGNIKQWNQLLAEAAHNAGVITDEEFAIFQNAGYMGLYGGMTVSDIHTKKGLKKNEKILDYMGSTELIANLFRISQTEEKLKRDEISTAIEANNTHYDVADKIRKAIIEMGATLPEDLPVSDKSVQTIEREEIRKLRNSKKKLMLDE
ncbi:DNA damage-inducible protein D [Desulfosporosinus sp. BICA1-9]|uniref:DNA damage-inducible protein D n=1 Tax=Desulfosporosinus sp. BICA1-9 TaxID=1531958 RepID=UPI00054C6BEE|nr:DNA damage-inducible protein D [Desulfosporosinus sp. BICA1-9]KJS83429.1 MAG: damage-indicible protein DnaD [Desulfosporosinus sp. BICA1-9]HBW35374.1 DNA damage-inducible protein D [Desulfosporosinus sp.]